MWTLFACTALSAGIIVFTFIRRKRALTLVITLAVFGYCMGNFFSQQKALRDASAAIVVVDSAAVYSLPIKDNGTVRELTRIPAGTELTLLETREGWFLVRLANGSEGWVEKNALAKLWENRD